MKSSFAIVGCGRVGSALAKYLVKSGYKAAGFASKSVASAKKVAEIAGAGNRFFKFAGDATKQADIVFITTPDDAIADTCRQLAAKEGIREKAVVLHCSGALPSTIMDPLKSLGVHVGSMHPLQSFAAARADNPFDRIMMAVEGDPEAIRIAEMIASDLGAVPFIIRTEGKTLYHASAVVASNYLVTLMALAFDMIAASGVPKSEAYRILKPLVNGTLANIENVGIPQALTGPIARGDYKTVTAHIDAIKDISKEALSLYKIFGEATIKLARAKGTLTAEAAEEILKIIKN